MSDQPVPLGEQEYREGERMADGGLYTGLRNVTRADGTLVGDIPAAGSADYEQRQRERGE